LHLSANTPGFGGERDDLVYQQLKAIAHGWPASAKDIC
jgi:hypothetical protein